MGNYLEMSKYYREYQEKETAFRRAKSDLDALKMSLLNSESSDSIMMQIEEAQARYDKAKQERDEAWYLANTGKPRQEVTAPVKFQSSLGFKGWW